MLPSSDSPPHHTKLKPPSLTDRIKPHHHRAIYFFLIVLLLQLLLLLSTPSLPFSLTHTTIPHIPSSPIQPNSTSPKCPYGEIYIYDLPPELNSDILKNCDKINPWLSRCDALSNSGFGSPAGDLTRIIPSHLTGAWHWTDQFSLEVIYHNRMLTYPCRTLNPSSASAFFIPFYTGLAIEPALFNKTSTDAERDYHCERMLDWVSQQEYYKKSSNGLNHFITVGRITWDFRRSRPNEWGSSCVWNPKMRNITRLLIERNPWDYFEFGVPYPTGFHPRSVSDVRGWQEFVSTRVRNTRFSFAGARRGYITGDFRGVLLNQCESEPGFCRVVDCGGKKCVNGSTAILEAFLDSEFCLQPRGDSLTRRSVFDCMVAGSIPVFFWHRTAYLQYEGFLPGEPGSYSVFIDRNEVKNGTSIKKVLDGFDEGKVREMRRNVIENIPKIVYAKTSQGLEGMSDAFDIGVEKVLRRIQKEGINGNLLT